MIRLLTLILLMSYITPSACQEVYTWVDSNGVRHFSDSSTDSKSTKLITPAFEPQTVPKGTKSQKFDNRSKSPQTLSIIMISPSNGETIRENNGIVTINIELNRSLTPSEQLQLVMDGKPYGAPSTKTVWQLKNLDRGSHRFSIQAVGSGKVIASSSVVTVYLHRASVN